VTDNPEHKEQPMPDKTDGFKVVHVATDETETVMIAGLPVEVLDPDKIIRDRNKPMKPGIIVPPMYAERLGLKVR
jgi:hypothetical protein